MCQFFFFEEHWKPNILEKEFENQQVGYLGVRDVLFAVHENTYIGPNYEPKYEGGFPT